MLVEFGASLEGGLEAGLEGGLALRGCGCLLSSGGRSGGVDGLSPGK